MTSADLQEQYLVRFGLAGPYARDPAVEGVDEVAAALHGMDVDSYRELQRSYVENAEATARALLAEPEFARLVDELHWEPGSTVLTVGDSITADRESWAEILRHCLALRREHDAYELVNVAVDGATSTDLLSRLDSMTNSAARYALILIGTNDAQAHGRDGLPLVSDDETLRNVDQVLGTLRAAEIEAYLMAPPPASIDQISTHWYLPTLPIGWEHLDAKRDVLRDHESCIFDCATAIGDPAEERLLMDGLHPNPDGQAAILRGLLVALTEKPPSAR